MCLQDYLRTDLAICSELAFKISSLRMYEKIACDHIPHLSHFLLHICIQFLHSTQTAKVNLSHFFVLFTRPVRYILVFPFFAVFMKSLWSTCHTGTLGFALPKIPVNKCFSAFPGLIPAQGSQFHMDP